MRKKGLNLYVVGHTDDTGSLAHNIDLSKRRADAVVQALVNDYGVTSNRLVSFGAGPYAVASNLSQEGREKKPESGVGAKARLENCSLERMPLRGDTDREDQTMKPMRIFATAMMLSLFTLQPDAILADETVPGIYIQRINDRSAALVPGLKSQYELCAGSRQLYTRLFKQGGPGWEAVKQTLPA